MKRLLGLLLFAVCSAGIGAVFAYYGALQNEAAVTTAFHRQYHNSWWNRTVQDTNWLGVKIVKNPMDMWIYQEILVERKPDVLVEMGTLHGGSALYFASIFDMIGKGRVITVDIRDLPNKPQHPRIKYLLGSSTSDAIARAVRAEIKPGETVMVVLDSDHHAEHVLRELEIYSPLVTDGQYIVVEDTHFGHPVDRHVPEFGEIVEYKAGPWEAVHEFLAKHEEFTADITREKFGLTFNPSGWLKKTGALTESRQPSDKISR